MKEFSQRIVTKTRALNDDLEDLTFKAGAADLKLRNCFNQFLMLNQSQFIENRVYDDEEDDEAKSSNPQTQRNHEPKDMVSKFKNALSKGMTALQMYTPPTGDLENGYVINLIPKN